MERQRAASFQSVELWNIDNFENGVEIIAEKFDDKIYTCLNETPEKLNTFREIVRKYCDGRIIFKDGTELMTSTKGLSADFVHPNVMGVYEITNNLTNFFQENLIF